MVPCFDPFTKLATHLGLVTPSDRGLLKSGLKNLLHFGFDLAPSEMSNAGQALLVNAIAYVARFTEDRPIVRTPCVFTQGKRIFDRSLWHRLLAVDNLADEKYEANGVESVLQEYFGDAVLSEAVTETLVTSYELETREPWFFARHKAIDNPGSIK